MRGHLLDELLGGLFIEEPEIELALIQFAEGNQRRQGHSAIAGKEGHILKHRENECRRFFSEGGKGILAEDCGLGTLHSVEKAELRFHHSGRSLMAAKLE